MYLQILFAGSMIYPSMTGTRYNNIFAMNVLIHDMYDIKSLYLSNKISINPIKFENYQYYPPPLL